MGFQRFFDSLGEKTLHPFLSRGFDDRLSALLIRSSTSVTWNVIALGALLSAVALFSLGSLGRSSQSSLAENAVISYAVIGVVWNALAANAHSASSGSYGRGLLLFVLWPLSFVYNWREAVRRHKRGRVADAG